MACACAVAGASGQAFLGIGINGLPEGAHGMPGVAVLCNEKQVIRAFYGTPEPTTHKFIVALLGAGRVIVCVEVLSHTLMAVT